jgi:5'(3')-deoxyribonucleotidase
MRRPLLCDSDGVLSDFNGYCIGLINREFGYSYITANNTEWEFTNLLKPAEHAEFRRLLTQPGICSALQPFPYARDLVQGLQALGNLYVVTSPLSGSRTWMAERYDWLEQLGVSPRRVVFAKDKSPVDGVVLIDDYAENLREWVAGGFGRSPILWRRVYSGQWGGLRVVGESVPACLELVQECLEATDHA